MIQQQQLSTAVSDLFLAFSCVVCIKLLTNSRPYDVHTACNFIYAQAGFILILIPSTLGIFRFGLYSPPDVLVRSHKYTSYLASVVGLSCFATEYFQNAKYSILGRLHLYSCICIVALQIILSQRHHFILSEFASSSAVVSIFLISAVTKDIYGILYALGMIFFGIVVGTEGQWIGFPAVDVFHYGLVLTNYCLVRSFLEMA